MSESRSELDSMVVGVELTLVSIIQGVALTVLIETARDVVTRPEFLPYLLAGLLTIFIFWSRAVLHIITVIRWPLEFGHNFLYIACALVEALLFSQLMNPLRWFAFGAGFMIIGWALFVYDLKLIRARVRDSAGPASNRMCDMVRRDQWLNIALLLPGVFLLNAACAFLIASRPDYFVGHRGHLWLVTTQLVGFVGYLGYLVIFYGKIAGLISDARAEWRSAAT